jgi:hypothetical protein
VEPALSPRKATAPHARSQPAPRPPHPGPAADDLRRAARLAEHDRRQAEQCAKLASLPVRHEHAAGIDVGDATHWVCVGSTPDGPDAVREFPAHTPGLRQLVAWLRLGAVTTVALEATGVYAHVLSLTLLEAGFPVVVAPPQFARPIKGRPRTDRRDCQGSQRLHRHGLLPAVFPPDEATQTLRDYVRQRANRVRLWGQHSQRLQKALGLISPKDEEQPGDRETAFVARGAQRKPFRRTAVPTEAHHPAAPQHQRRLSTTFRSGSPAPKRRRLSSSVSRWRSGTRGEAAAQCRVTITFTPSTKAAPSGSATTWPRSAGPSSPRQQPPRQGQPAVAGPPAARCHTARSLPSCPGQGAWAAGCPTASHRPNHSAIVLTTSCAVSATVLAAPAAVSAMAFPNESNLCLATRTPLLNVVSK